MGASWDPNMGRGRWLRRNMVAEQRRPLGASLGARRPQPPRGGKMWLAAFPTR